MGKETFRICQEHVDEMVTVSTDEICAAIKDGFNETRTVLEPAGALGIAGACKYAARTGVSGQSFAVIMSGANMDFGRLRHVYYCLALNFPPPFLLDVYLSGV